MAPKTIEYSGVIFSRYIRGGRVLELGPAEGVMTEILADLSDDLTVVDGASEFCAMVEKRVPKAKVVESLFEAYQPDERFDHIVLGHVLEHVLDPVALLQQARGWLTPTGRVYAAVPNARSVHRQAAVLMGLLKTEYDMSPNDIHHGHRRIYGPETFRNDFLAAGYNIDVFGGYWLKPVSNSQIEASWTPEMLDAFMQMGERYPDIAAEIYVIASDNA